MSKFIDAERLRAEINETINGIVADALDPDAGIETVASAMYKKDALSDVLALIDSLQQEQPEVDLEKLGEIARHLIAVKDHEEDMRLDEGEWLLLERIGYPERFNARKED